MKHTYYILIALLAISLIGCKKTAVIEEPDSTELDKISSIILQLPEVQALQKPALMIASEPTEEEPFYTIQVGDNFDDRFVTQYWFHAYSEDDIRFWDVRTDTEQKIDIKR
jgi:hypothetical protein